MRALMICALLLPLAGGLLLPLLRFRSGKSMRVFVGGVTLAVSALAGLLCAFPPEGTLRVLSFTPTLELALRIDGTGRIFMALLAVLWPPAMLYAFDYMEHETRQRSFFAWYTLSFFAVLGVAMAANLFSLYLFFEGVTLFTLPLVTHKRDAASIRAGRRYLAYSLTGATVALIGIVLLTGGGTMPAFVPGGSVTPERGAEELYRWAFLAAFVGFSVKAAMFPLHAWLPAASVAPTPVTALLHAVAVVNAGAFACLRLTCYTCGTAWLRGSWVQAAVLGLAAFTVLFGSVTAFREKHLKRRLAWSTVSNLSYILFGIALMTPEGLTAALTHIWAHSLTKIVLFYAAGAVLVRTGRETVQETRGLGKRMPWTFAAFTLAALSLMGVPPLVGFQSKWNLLEAAVSSGLPMGMAGFVALLISTVLTAVYSLGVVIPAFFLPPEEAERLPCPGRLDPSWRMLLPMFLILCPVVLLGLAGAEVTRIFSEFASKLL